MSQSYDDWFRSTFDSGVRAPGTVVATSWSPDSEWGHRAHCALLEIEVDYVKDLIRRIRDENVPGDFAEFGIFKGWWVDKLWELTQDLEMDRKVYGFDSFEGLSKPDAVHDVDFWQEGMYACSLEQVSANVKIAERPRIKLVKGFFADSLHKPEALEVGKLAFVRIDCDIYEPALQCLRYIAPRLSDGAILIFDDWPHLRHVGEQKAFEEWLPEVPHLRFEFLFFNTYGHFYLKAHRR